jgi:hypothetical protein
MKEADTLYMRVMKAHRTSSVAGMAARTQVALAQKRDLK